MIRQFEISDKADIISGRISVFTEHGEPVEIVKWDCCGKYPILACIFDGDTSDSCFYDINGISATGSKLMVTKNEETLDEAANEYADGYFDDCTAAKRAAYHGYKAGAEWAFKQGFSVRGKLLDGFLYTDYGPNYFNMGYKTPIKGVPTEGDAIDCIVQIRKDI